MKIINFLTILIVLIIIINFYQPSTIGSQPVIKDINQTQYFKKLRRGDLVFCEIRNILVLLGGHDVEAGFDHVAIYLGKGHVKNGKFIENNETGRHYVLEATFLPFTKVRYTQLSLLFIYSHLQFARVIDADETTIEYAITFGESQIGKGYQHFFLKPKCENPTFPWEYEPWDINDENYKFRNHANNNPNDKSDPFSDWYYCADLAWACYYNAGIDLDPKYPEDRDQNGTPDEIEGYGLLRFVSPQNLFDTEKTVEI